MEVPRTGGIISPSVLPDNGQLEPYSDELPENGFLHSETDPDTPFLPSVLEETDHNDFCHIDFDEDSRMTPIFDLATAGLQKLARLSGKSPNKSNRLSCKTIMKCFCIYGIPLDLLWLPRKISLHSQAQSFVNDSVNTFYSANKNFDNTLNALHLITLLEEKENNE